MFGFSSGQILVIVVVCLLVLGPAKTLQTLSFIFDKIAAISKFVRKLKREIDLQSLMDGSNMPAALDSFVQTSNSALNSITDAVEDLACQPLKKSDKNETNQADIMAKEIKQKEASGSSDKAFKTPEKKVRNEEIIFDELENCKEDIERLEAELSMVKQKLESYAKHE
ncbi:MAG: hypothetical protein ACI4ND_07610 [Succinivibrio sp.]